MREHPHEYILENTSIPGLTHSMLLQHSSEIADTGKRGFFEIQPESIEIDSGLFMYPSSAIAFPAVAVSQVENTLIVSCECNLPKKKLCGHQVQVLYNIMDRQHLRIFFDRQLRLEKIKQVAKEYGLENEADPETYFEIHYTNRSFEIKPKLEGLFPVNPAGGNYLREALLPKLPKPPAQQQEHTKRFVVFGKHRHYDQFHLELFEAPLSKDGKIKAPFTSIDPLPLIWKTNNIEEAKFYTGISKFQNNYTTSKSESDLDALRPVVKNPLQLDVYYHDLTVSEKISPASIVSVTLQTLNSDLQLYVDRTERFYEVYGDLVHNEKSYALKTLKIKYDYFVQIGSTLHLIADPDLLRIIDFFQKNNPKILIHLSKYDEFYQQILAKLEQKINIRYSFIKPATKKQIKEQGFDQGNERIIYLSDREHFISITPVMRYGNIEIPVFSKRQVHDEDQNGNVFKVERDTEEEIRFTSVLLRQHPDFEEQLLEHEYLYLHKDKFLADNWFLDAFEEWRAQHILILGFDELKNNKLNAHRATVSVSVNSGIDWFNTTVKVNYGKQTAKLKQLYKAIRNKSKFVQLDDGTQGILPEEWIRKFSDYFESGEIVGEEIHTPKTSFPDIERMYEREVLTREAQEELDLYSRKFADVAHATDVPVPAALNATLRDYQKQGLNWLNLLDEFNFGACLADDMGLGKTVQVIAFILSQREKNRPNTNLVVVPTSLLFNWQSEVEKFAPSIKLFTNYGNTKLKSAAEFDTYEIILTTYGMLLSDIDFLKQYRFNYIFLDESQAIKNPESQRYKAARLLQSRNKVVLTGTPVENNTFDIYGQLSFACPGLLGNKQQFKDLYSTPIDKFSNSKRAAELQRKISPFILRRTKKQVATELPEKTEMVIYCEMGDEQRKIYDSHEKELRDFISSKDEEEIKNNSMHVLRGITKLRQICNSPALLKEDVFYGNYSSKIELLAEQIENKSQQHKILVFSQFVSMLDLIKKELEKRNIAFEYLSGQTRNRANKVNTFQNNDDVRVFLISLKAGGTGLNLTEADYVYIVDPWWNPAVENQAIDRSYRIGQTKHVIAVRLICPGTIEEKIMKLQESKNKLVSDLIKTDGAVLKSLSRKELLTMLK